MLLAPIFGAIESDDADIFSTSTDFSTEEDVDEKHPKINDFIQSINLYNDEDFSSHFRMQRETVLVLIERYDESAYIPPQDGGGRRRVGAELEVYLYIWYISNTCTFREIANLFGVAKSTAWSVVSRVAKWLISLSHLFIKWPKGDEVRESAEKFYEKKRIPGIIGAIDCTHIRIRKPGENAVDYFNKKKFYSLSVQAVVNSEKKFIDVMCAEPGSLHDSRVLRRSNLFRRTQNNVHEVFPNNTLLIGDSAYPSLNWLVPAFNNYRDRALTVEQVNFNKDLSSTRMVVENTFQKLKMRFRRLAHFTEQFHIHLIVNIIASICVLHNHCIDEDDLFLDPDDLDDDSDDPDPDDLDDDNGDNDHEFFREVNVPRHADRRAELLNEINNRL